jgi:diguanylate cyclase (GGDEF)-like protein
MFEGYMARSLKSVDTTLRVLRSSYLHDPTFDISAWARNPDVQNDLALQLSIIGADGVIKMSTSDIPLAGINIGDREHFRIHINSAYDEVFVSPPVILRTRSKWAITVSRRISAADGSFAGVISAVIDPLQLQSFYDELDLGVGGIASLAGFDGIIRARGGSDSSAAANIGKTILNAEVMRRYKDAPSGSYWNAPEGTVDNVRRLITYRVIDGFPLIAIVGLAESDIYRHTQHNARVYFALSAGVILVIAIFIGFGAARERKLRAVGSSLARTNAWFESALANLPLGLCMFGPDKRLTVCNDLYRQMYDLTSEQTKVGTALPDILQARLASRSRPKDVDERQYIEKRMVKAFRPEPGHLMEELQDGRILAVSRQCVPGGGWITVHQDVTAAKRAEAEITQLAHYDCLTRLANRTLFLQRVNAAAEEFQETGARFAVHLLDLDRFKEVNDTLGHVFGDSLLKAVAERIRARVSNDDLVARLGGDEFAILQPLTDGDEAQVGELADMLLKSVREPFGLGDHTVTVETSIGIALAPDHGQQADQLLKTADLALYKAKSEGRNTYRVFKPEMELQARARHALEIDLRNAIARNEFELHYQPIMSTVSKQICGVEALVRWRHPRRGLVAPDAFIPLAEETGLIVPLGEWVLRTACHDAVNWPEHIKLAVNLSSVQFRQGNLLGMVTSALQDSGLPASRLELEVTESVLLQNNEENLALLHQFRGLGISIALDDFGTGYSSLSYLQRFPFDKIKIDRSFVANMTTRADCVAIVSAVTGLARALDIMTTAEGVETPEQLVLLQAAGCGLAQGYLFGKPRHKDDLGFDWVAGLREQVVQVA